MLDPTDVTLWHRIGSHAITLGRLALARHAFTSGLSCNENYWPCLDASITVLYALSDYECKLMQDLVFTSINLMLLNMMEIYWLVLLS